MANCLHCGKPLKTFSFEFFDGVHPECDEEYSTPNVSEYKKEVKEGGGSQIEDIPLYSNSQPNSKYSLNAYLADTTIAFVGFFFFIIVALLIYISYKIGQWFGGGLGFDIFIIGLVFIILNFGLFAIFAEIYRHLKEINSKTKHPDKN